MLQEHRNILRLEEPFPGREILQGVHSSRHLPLDPKHPAIQHRSSCIDQDFYHLGTYTTYTKDLHGFLSGDECDAIEDISREVVKEIAINIVESLRGLEGPTGIPENVVEWVLVNDSMTPGLNVSPSDGIEFSRSAIVDQHLPGSAQ